jgi:hypothetical protein
MCVSYRPRITVVANDTSFGLLMSQARLLLIMFVEFETPRTSKLMIDRIPGSLDRRERSFGLAPPIDAQVCAPHRRKTSKTRTSYHIDHMR